MQSCRMHLEVEMNENKGVFLSVPSLNHVKIGADHTYCVKVLKDSLDIKKVRNVSLGLRIL